jgi:ribosomal protein S27AE
MKKCKICFAEKSFSDYYKGHAQCKKCYIAKVKKYSLENSDKVKAYDKKRFKEDPRVLARHKRYAASAAGRAAVNRGKAGWVSRNRIKKGAAAIVGNAVRDGRLIRPDACEECGSGNVHGHHDDYALPLAVRWLCAMCHRKWHKENGQGANG